MFSWLKEFFGFAQRDPHLPLPLVGGKVDTLTKYNADQVTKAKDEGRPRPSSTHTDDGVTPAIIVLTTQATGGGSSCDPPSSSGFDSSTSSCDITSDPWAGTSLQRGPSL
jgi:hypothetical protein